MTLPLTTPLAPQLALTRKALPEGEEYVYEIKLDGFRCLAFVDGEEVFLQSRGSRPLGRYFPELKLPPGRYVLDGEIVVRVSEGGAAGRRTSHCLSGPSSSAGRRLSSCWRAGSGPRLPSS